MPTKTLRFVLSEIELFYDGDKFVPDGSTGRRPYGPDQPDKADNIVEARLIYPRSGAPVVTTSKTMDLPSRTNVTLDIDDFWTSGLFKEDVDSETKFVLLVSDRDSNKGLFSWLGKIAASMFSTVIGGRVKQITNLFQGAVASDLQGRLDAGLKDAKSDDPKVQSLGKSKEIIIELTPNGFDAYYKSGSRRISVTTQNRIEIDLYASKSFGVRRSPTAAERRRSATARGRMDIKFRKGSKIGKAVVLVSGA